MGDHARVAPNLIKSMVEEVKKGKKTAEAAADELARHCGCGVFNPYRAAKLLQKMAAV
jgi:hypothetical protein